MLYREIVSALGYRDSSLFHEENAERFVSLSDRHWVRAARAAGVRGSYFFRTSPEAHAFRPAVHIAEARTEDEARAVHARLWNQGITPFLIVILPQQVRVYTGFAYDPAQLGVGAILKQPLNSSNIAAVADALSAFNAEAIDQGTIWQTQARHLGTDQRVDSTLLAHLRALSTKLQSDYNIPDVISHALIGKFVYLAYLRARDILSDKWLQDEAGVDPQSVFSEYNFSPTITLDAFRQLAKKVEARFNGKLFPIPWGSRRAPKADSIRTVARVFAGEDILSGQLHLSFRAYDFSYIPVEFLSSIYEQFLHAEGGENSDGVGVAADASDPEKGGAHYTPEPLADYLVSEVNSVRQLKSGMKILDPCCGSGVFLVVAYRRLVELECRNSGRSTLNASELKVLLQESIYAVERNVTACQIAGFSLILALLSYVDPPELHRHKQFKFPTLVGNNLFPEDFFNPQGRFWSKTDSDGQPLRFDWIVGNPPWVELNAADKEEHFLLDWSKRNASSLGLARARTGEAFAWRVLDCLADNGAIGVILSAKSLTNDHLASWREKFFQGVQVRRVTNLANLAYVIFASAQQPAATLIYTRRKADVSPSPILHFGPFVANQCTLGPKGGKKRRAWVISFSECEIKSVPYRDAEKGAAATWKMALWGTPRDAQAIQRLKRVFATTLGSVAEKRNWHLGLGLQLRAGVGSPADPNEYVEDLEGLKVLNHEALVAERGRGLIIRDDLLQNNELGCYVRKGRLAGLKLTSGPRLFLWNDFAAYSTSKFIIRHAKLGLSGGSALEMKAVSALWNSSFVQYLLFFVTSANLGVGYNVIDKRDAETLPFPELTPEREQKLAAAWEEAIILEKQGADWTQIRHFFDKRVASALGLPTAISLVVGDFFDVRYQLNKGKSPPALRSAPSEPEFRKYATRLRYELDLFTEGKSRHAIVVLYSSRGASVSIRVAKQEDRIEPQIRPAAGSEAVTLIGLLDAAESQFSQWTYVKRSLRVFEGDTIHLLKPPRRLEWAETNALIDADDIIAEVVQARSGEGRAQFA